MNNEYMKEDLLFEKIELYKEKLKNISDEELINFENDIYETKNEKYKIITAFSDTYEIQNYYDGKDKDKVLLLLKKIYELISVAKNKDLKNEYVDYDQIKKYIICCNILMKENVSFYKTLKYIDTKEMKNEINNIMEEGYGNVRYR